VEETGECGERQLNHSDGEAERFYRDLRWRGIRVRVGLEATGYSRWFERRDRIIYAQHIAKHGMALYREICERDLEGMVCKRKNGAYSSAGYWLKVLNPNYTQHDGRHEKFTAFKDRSSRTSR
jgi:hypothetical protein